MIIMVYKVYIKFFFNVPSQLYNNSNLSTNIPIVTYINKIQQLKKVSCLIF